jgi:hypothetical protein
MILTKSVICCSILRFDSLLAPSGDVKAKKGGKKVAKKEKEEVKASVAGDVMENEF